MIGERKERDYPPKTKKEKKDEKGKEKRIGLRERNSELSRLFNEPTARGETRNQTLSSTIREPMARIHSQESKSL